MCPDDSVPGLPTLQDTDEEVPARAGLARHAFEFAIGSAGLARRQLCRVLQAQPGLGVEALTAAQMSWPSLLAGENWPRFIALPSRVAEFRLLAQFAKQRRSTDASRLSQVDPEYSQLLAAELPASGVDAWPVACIRQPVPCATRCTADVGNQYLHRCGATSLRD